MSLPSISFHLSSSAALRSWCQTHPFPTPLPHLDLSPPEHPNCFRDFLVLKTMGKALQVPWEGAPLSCHRGRPPEIPSPPPPALLRLSGTHPWQPRPSRGTAGGGQRLQDSSLEPPQWTSTLAFGLVPYTSPKQRRSWLWWELRAHLTSSNLMDEAVRRAQKLLCSELAETPSHKGKGGSHELHLQSPAAFLMLLSSSHGGRAAWRSPEEDSSGPALVGRTQEQH